jgi:uncharacterized protein YbjT (DUF2867 family)
MAKTVLVSGGSGFIGTHVVDALVAADYEVRAMTRRPDSYRGAGTAVAGDVTDPASLAKALDGVDYAYYLVHSLGSPGYAETDARGARAFAAACGQRGVDRLIYLGGLGDEPQLSAHLRSRREVERLLRAGPVPLTVLRAAVVIGHRSIVWEIIRQLVDHLPGLLTPRWVVTRTQPIAMDDAVRYLVGVLDQEDTRGRVYEIGGPDVLSYLGLLQRTAAVQGRRLPNVTLPLLSPRLSALWLTLITDVNTATARDLVDSMTVETVVREHAIQDVLPGPCLGFDEAARRALAACRASPRGSHGRSGSS